MDEIWFSKNTRPSHATISEGHGEFFVDVNGKRYLDFCSQTLNLSLGHCHPDVNCAIVAASARFTQVSSRFSTDYADELAQVIIENAPHGLTRVNLRITSGTLANEGALKIAYKQTGKKGVLSLIGSHHGQSIETMRISGKNFDKEYLDRSGLFFAYPPGWADRMPKAANIYHSIFDAIKENKDRLAAVIVEPVMVDAGIIVLPQEYLQEVREWTQRYGLVLIFDEVQTAFGWTGYLYAANYFGVVPDVLTGCKGFAAGLPLALMLMRASADILEYGEHEITHGGNPIACAVALANIRLLTKTDLLERVKSNGQYLLASLQQVSFEFPAEIKAVRGLGLICGVEINDNSNGRSLSKAIFETCIKHGLLLRLSKVGENNNVLQFKPPLITSRDSIDEAIDIFRKVLALHSEKHTPRISHAESRGLSQTRR